ncbi:DUF5130 family protein [Kutzneria buriramensis]|uniref:Uncharacterized protein DUF5130 n=1 Tax=Kutzneria buriramensis TaxID=1045776 RepID=A0A3E0HEE8_9PSEU|nr:DUF5130 family protein [Kutzneria buriramensis]REH42781.1 uncharacterized protein DUF5130 [Kutzneria buriramensis]
MATGEIVQRRAEDSELAYGEALMADGRVSAAIEQKPSPPSLPFRSSELAQLDEALTLSSRETGLDFSVYLGELDGDDTRKAAEELHAQTPRPTLAVLIAVSPGQRAVEIVTGEESHRRLADRGCKLAVMSMVASFKEGDLAGGLVSGLRMLTDQAGPAPRR